MNSMANPRLTDKQRDNLFAPLIAQVRELIRNASDGDTSLYWALRRKLYKELSYDERGTPSHRKALKKRLRKLQNGLCSHCNNPLPESGAVNDRIDAIAGYTDDNVLLVCPDCDTSIQQSRGYTDSK